MRDENEIVLAEQWNGYGLLNNVVLPLSNPSIDLNITTKIAGALMLHGDYLYVTSTDGKKINATFDGSTELYKYFTPSEYLSLNSNIGDSATMRLLFDKDPSRGHMTNSSLFIPKSLDINIRRHSLQVLNFQ